MSLSRSESKLELETHHSSTIFCDMMSPDEWKSSLPLVFQQNDVSSLANSSTSPSNSIEDLVLELENSSQDVDLGYPFAPDSDNLMSKESSSDKYEEEELICNMDTDANDMPDEVPETEKEIGNMDTDANDMPDEVTETEKEIDLSSEKLLPQNDEPESVVTTGTEFETEAVVNLQKSPDPLSIFLSRDSLCKSNLAQVPAEVVRQFHATEMALAPDKDKTDVSLQRLTSRLAKVIHCNSPDNANVLQKATSTISTLRQQACDLMSTYSQLKFQNDELIQKQHQLHSEQFLGEPGEILRGCPLIIEVLIPTPGARKAFDSARLYHHIPIEDGQIPTTSGDESYSAAEEIFDEPYEEHYDAQTHTPPLPLEAYPCKNKKPPCKLGCICSSLDTGKLPVEHCKNPKCMLEPRCSHPGDPSHARHTVFTITNERNIYDTEKSKGESGPTVESISAKSRPRTAKLSTLRSIGSSSKNKAPCAKTKRPKRGRPKKNVVLLSDPKIDSRDPKLLNNCNVRLVKLDLRSLHRKPNGYFDAKLYMKCSVHLQRLQTKQDQSLYCMHHRLHNCICCPGSPTINI